MRPHVPMEARYYAKILLDFAKIRRRQTKYSLHISNGKHVVDMYG